MEQLVDKGGLDFFGIVLRCAGERPTAHIDDAASHDRKGQNALVAASRVHVAVLDDNRNQVFGDTHVQLGQSLCERPPPLVGELSQESLTLRCLERLGCLSESLTDSVTDIGIFYVDASPRPLVWGTLRLAAHREDHEGDARCH